MKITFIMPSIGKKKGVPYSRSWLMEPLGLAVIAACTPRGITRELYDDRLEAIPYDKPTDLVALSVETYSAKRAYQIADEFRRRKVPVVMGGYHPTLVPEETLLHADAIVAGEGENVWQTVLADLRNGRLQKQYRAPSRTNLAHIFPDRSLFKGKRYVNLTLIETGRGCRFGCEFCSIHAFYRQTYAIRPVKDVVAEIVGIKAKNIFFVDDNIANDPERARELFSALVPLGIRWISQVSMHIYKDHALLELMRKSGCKGVLIGFESLQPENLQAMGKAVNNVADGYDKVVQAFHKHRLAIYGTFVFGYRDSRETFTAAYAFALKNKLFYAAFNHLVPFPGTPLYRRLELENRLRYSSWWTHPECRFGNVYFIPDAVSPAELERLCYANRLRYFKLPALLYRLANPLYRHDLFSLAMFLLVNLSANGETQSRRLLPFGATDG
jgi:radical SAM superfamily enzyme YgiQ (UPF0313 family)